MKLANASELLSDVISFAASFAGGEPVWVNGKLGCSVVSVPLGSSTYSQSDNQICYRELLSFCEYDSE